MQSAGRGQFFFRLCSDHVSIEAIPAKRVSVDLAKVKTAPVQGHRLLLWTPAFVVLQNREGHEVTVRRDGRMVVRKAGSEEVARRAAISVFEIMSRDFPH